MDSTRDGVAVGPAAGGRSPSSATGGRRRRLVPRAPAARLTRRLAREAGHLRWTVTADGLVDAAEGWCPYTGQRPAEAAGWGWLAVVHPDDRERVRREWTEALAAGSRYESAYRLRHADGTYRSCLVRAIPIAASGAPRAWAGFCVDLGASPGASYGDDGRLEAVFDALADGVFVYDLEGRVTRMNAAGRALLALDAGPLPHRPAWESGDAVAIRAPDGPPLPVERWPLYRVLHGEVIGAGAAEEVLVRALDGRERPLAVTGSPLRDAAGRLTGGVIVLRDLSEQRRLESQAAAQAAQLDAIFEAVPDPLALHDAAGTIVRRNRASQRFFPTGRGGESPVESLAAYQLLPAGDEPPDPEQLPVPRALRGETVVGVEFRVGQGTVEDRYIEASAAPLRGPDGKVAGVVSVAHDITALRRAEQAASARASQFEAIIEAVSDAVFVFGHDGRATHMNTAARRLFAFDAPLAFDTPPRYEPGGTEVRDADDRRLAEPQWPLYRILAGQTLTGADTVELRVRRRDGRVMDLDVAGAPIRDAGGRIVGAVCAVRDVTDRRAQERHTREALEALLEMARTLVAPSAEEEAEETGSAGPSTRVEAIGQRLVDLTRRVLGCRRLAMVAIEPRTGLQTPLAAVGLTPEEERLWRESTAGVSLFAARDPLTAAIVERIRGGEVFVLDMTQPPLDANPYGVRHLLVAPMCIGDDLVGLYSMDYGAESHTYTADELALAGAVARLAALTIERERLIREREEARAGALALREANRRMDEFLGLASHELRTPLTGLRGSLQVMQRRLERAAGDAPDGDTAVLAGRLAPFLERAWRQSGVLAGLVDDLLDLSRTQAGQLQLHLAPLDLIALVRQAVEERVLLDPERTIGLEAPAGPVAVTADARRLAQVVDHYLDNALKFSAEAEPVTVGVTVEGSTARVWVRDAGPGIPPGEQDDIWERFYRPAGTEHRSGSSEGLGLGLYLCRAIVERHGGRVGVESAPGAGATFWFSLPLMARSGDGEREPAP